VTKISVLTLPFDLTSCGPFELSRSSPPVHILHSLCWDPNEADITILCDASPTGMGFWIPAECIGFHATSPFEELPFIFFLEALCILNALLFSEGRGLGRTKVLLYTDNHNTVDIFSSLHCLPEYNGIIRSSVDLRLRSLIDLHVLHIPEEDNGVADALSHGDIARALSLCPTLQVTPFNPFVPSPHADDQKPPQFNAGGDSI